MTERVDVESLRALVKAVRAEGRDAGYHWTEHAEQIASLLAECERLRAENERMRSLAQKYAWEAVGQNSDDIVFEHPAGFQLRVPVAKIEDAARALNPILYAALAAQEPK